LAAVELDLLLHGEAELHGGGARQLCLDDARIHRRPTSATLIILVTRTCPVSVSTSTSTRCRDHPERRRVRRQPIGVGRHVIRDVAAGADDIAGLHLVFLHEQSRDRHVSNFRHADLARQRRELALASSAASRTALPM